MSRTYSAGIATAYGAAVRGGYTGTYEEFCAALGDLARVLTEFEHFQATAQTLAAGEEATASYNDGILTLGIPTGNGIQSISLLSTVGLIKTYRITYTNGNVFDFPVADGKGIKNTVLNSDYTLTITYTDDTTWTSTSIRGEVGATPQFSIGTVETLLPTQPASATITGTPERPVLNLAIPRGQDGSSDAGAITYSQETAYNDNTVGKELNSLNHQLGDVEDVVISEEDVDGSDLTWSKLIINEDGTTSTYTNDGYCITSSYVAVGDNKVFKYTGLDRYNNANYYVRICEYEYNNLNAFIKRTGISPENQNIYLPVTLDPSCNYIRVSIGHATSTNVKVPLSEGSNASWTLSHNIVDLIDDIKDEEWKRYGLHTKPETQTAFNIVKRCRQMTDIKWTPAVNLPRLMMVQTNRMGPSSTSDEWYEGVFKAGIEYRGIPYGRCTNYKPAYGYSNTYVGLNIDFETFVTSIENANSMLCKESVFDLLDHRSVPFAAVCSALICYALNVPYVATANIPSINGLYLIGKINNAGTLLAEDQFQVGDIMNLQGYHAVVITDIVKDSEGHITSIEISEATPSGLADKSYDDEQVGGLCRRKGWTINEIYTLWGEYSVYRYAITTIIPYTQSQHVKIGDELDMYHINRFLAMPYEGNGFAYKTGHIPNNAVKVVINSTDYDYLRVFKDGTEIAASPFAVNDAENITITEIGVGDYTAYLCNMSDGNVITDTAPCKWSVVA